MSTLTGPATETAHAHPRGLTASPAGLREPRRAALPAEATVRRTALLGAAAGFVCAVGFGYLSIDSLLHPGARYYRDVVFLWPWLSGAAALVAVHLVQRGPGRRAERVGAWLTFGGMALSVLGMAPRMAGGDEPWTALLGPAMGAWVLGMVVLGVGTWRAGVVPAWAGVAIALAEPATVGLAGVLRPISPLTDVGSYSGALGNAVAWLLVACALLTTASLHREPATSHAA
ncbi:hypothetical protein [Pseudofrankia inefficax]|uniref:Integral membrane protein n=1 Tax=Pseudofrankia inefficax (strain DSM 45817 / CECT 9037 / DDB 130130 / EuI1c) TaxID=298654 RepID=E3JCD6_PSEI1|nr:hypothetical protein [Pseudofrankia inefficax]ADP84725.1 hypothetical protein FraEuI1c_6756 [Pseudofrankia inefficax]